MNKKLAQHRKSNFAPAFMFLSKERREALQTLYAVCRVLDDAVDHQRIDPASYLLGWKKVFINRDPSPVAPFGEQDLAESFLDIADRYHVPLEAMIDLVDKGVSIDLKPARFQTAMDTEAYCYGVASTVGIACLPIFGVPVGEAKPYAVRLGIAVQWTNLIRDVGVDAKMGRVYIPLDHLMQFGYTETDLFGSKINLSFQSLLEFEYQLAVGHFKRADELLPLRWKHELKPARIMGSIYKDLLLKIKNRKFPVFNEKVHLNWWEKTKAVWKEMKN